MRGECFLVSHRELVRVVRKLLKLKSILLEGLEFDDTFKTNNSSSQEENDLLSLLERTVDLHFVQLCTKSRDVSDHITGYAAFEYQILQRLLL